MKHSLLLTVALLTCVGCSNLPRSQARFTNQPAQFKRVALLPSLFTGYAVLDADFTLAQRRQRNQELARTTLQLATESMTTQGYTISGKQLALAIDEDWDQFDWETRELLWETHAEFAQVARAVRRNLAAERREPFCYRMGLRLNELCQRLKLHDADALLLFRTESYYLPPEGFGKHLGQAFVVGLTLGAAAAAPGFESLRYREYILHEVALVDSRTRELLWYNAFLAVDQSICSPFWLSTTTRNVLKPLPDIP